MKLTATAVLAATLPLVLAGLEDAKYSTTLTAQNFDSAIASKSHGSLVAFFAPWCGHCKSLEPVWTKIAKAFEGDDRCQVAHFNADDADARPIASKYGVSGYPTIKFLAPSSKGAAVEAYQGARSEEAFLEFLNEKCGTDKLPGGLLSDLAGRIPSLDSLASSYLAPTATRPDLLASASAIASSLAADTGSALSAYYLRIFAKFADVTDSEGVEAAKAWVAKERERLGKLASKKGQVAVAKLEEAKMKQNILAAFAEAKATASSVSSVAAATASSVSSVASASASSLSSVGADALSTATESASSLAGAATASASSLAGAATASASSLAGDAAASASSLAASAAASASSLSAAASASAASLADAASSAGSSASESASSVYGKATAGAGEAYQRVKEEL
ncbi:hypothetical protein JCM10450v2_008106 [Rhodotorula kratochvilovae]